MSKPTQDMTARELLAWIAESIEAEGGSLDQPLRFVASADGPDLVPACVEVVGDFAYVDLDVWPET